MDTITDLEQFMHAFHCVAVFFVMKNLKTEVIAKLVNVKTLKRSSKVFKYTITGLVKVYN